MSIKYEIHSIKSSKGAGEEQEFVRIFEYPPQTNTLYGDWKNI